MTSFRHVKVAAGLKEPENPNVLAHQQYLKNLLPKKIKKNFLK